MIAGLTLQLLASNDLWLALGFGAHAAVFVSTALFTMSIVLLWSALTYGRLMQRQLPAARQRGSTHRR
jgi:chromate transport protein ChrA